MLTLFDFEKSFYNQNDMPAVHCGYPLIDIISENPDFISAKKLSREDSKKCYLAILLGSRVGEVEKILPIFIFTVEKLNRLLSELHCLIPAANDMLEASINDIMLNKGKNLSYTVISQQTKTAMAASDAVLLVSGTVALEAMLLQKPMLVAYKLSGLTACWLSAWLSYLTLL